MTRIRPIFFFIFCLYPVSSSLASADNFKCGGFNTVLYSNKARAITICHGPHTKIIRSKLNKWNNCFDATILLRNKTTGKNSVVTDCYPQNQKQFSVQGGTLRVRHFYTEYPGFDSKPLVIETLDAKKNRRHYKLERKFKKCTTADIDAQNRLIQQTVSKPFDGSTFFKSVYGAFFKLRDCSFSYPDKVINILNSYWEIDRVDGEVAETLGTVVDEAKIIKKAVNNKSNL